MSALISSTNAKTKGDNPGVKFTLKQRGCYDNCLSNPGHRIVTCLGQSLPWIWKRVPLQTLAICRRCERILYKLKTSLQNLGLPRAQVHRGLLQLVTRSCVFLERLPTTAKRHGLKKLSLENDEEKPRDHTVNYRTRLLCDEKYSRKKHEVSEKLDVTEHDTGGEYKRDGETERLKAQKTASSPQQSDAPIRGCKLEDKTTTSLHSFDRALEQLDMLAAAKSNMSEKLVGKRTTVIVSADTTYKSQDQNCAMEKHLLSSKKCSNNDDIKVIKQGIPDLMADKVGKDFSHLQSQEKKSRIKLNLLLRNQKGSDSSKIPVKENPVNTYIPSDKIKCCEQSTIDKPSDITEAMVKDNSHKRRSNETEASDYTLKRKKISSYVDEIKRINKEKKKKVKSKFRSYFGECISVSEDEQEKHILQKRFKRKRMKNSVESCDSGICSEEGPSSVKVSKDVQRAEPDSTVQEEVNENSLPEVTVKSEISNEPKSINVDKDYTKAVNETGRRKRVTGTEDDKSRADRKADSLQPEQEEIIQRELTVVDENTFNSDTSNNTWRIVDSPPIKTEQTRQEEETIIFNENVENNKSKDTHEISPDLCSSSKKRPQTEVQQDILTTEILEENNSSKINVVGTAIKGGENINATYCDSSKLCDKIRNVPNMIPDEIIKCLDSNLITKGTNEDLSVDLDDVCEIMFNEGIRITEENVEKDANQNIVSKGTDKNTNLKVLSGMESNDKEIVKDMEQKSYSNMINNVEANDTQVYLDKEENVLVNRDATTNVLNDISQVALQEPELNKNTEKEDTQSISTPPVRLRVLSSAELGSRWCPTPIHTAASTLPPTSNGNTSSDVPLTTTVKSSLAALQETVNAAVPMVSPSVSVSVPTELFTATTKAVISKTYAKCIQNTLMSICRIIQHIRFNNFHLKYDILLLKGFKKLGDTLNVDNYVAILYDVVKILNKVALVNQQPVTEQEILSYSPSFHSLYMSSAQKYVKFVQSNFHKNSATMNSPADYNVQQTNHNAQKQQPPLQQRTHQAYLMGPRVNNTKAPQGFPLGYSSGTSLNSYQLERSACTPIIKPPRMNQQASSGIYAPSENVFYNVNANTMHMPSNLVQQNSNSDYTKNAQNVPVVSPEQQFHHTLYRQRRYVPEETFYVPTPVSQLSQNIQPSMSQVPQTMKHNVPQKVQKMQQNVPQAHQNMQPNMPQMSHGTKPNIQVCKASKLKVPVIQSMTQSVIQAPQNMQQKIPHLSQNIRLQSTPQLSQNVRQNVPQLSQNIQQQNVPRLPQNVQHGVPLLNYMPQPAQKRFATNTSQPVPRNTENEHIFQKVVQQIRLNGPPNFTVEQSGSPQYTPNILPSKIKQPVLFSKRKVDDVQVSLESTMKQFDVLKHLTDIQKIMLHEQMNFYFDCTTWLQQPFTSEKWHVINSERSMLLNFRTLLKHLVEKVLSNLSTETTAEKKTPKNIKIDVPQKVQIIVQENQEALGQENLPQTKQKQHGKLDADQRTVTRQENVRIIPNESLKEQKVTANNSANSEAPRRRRRSETSKQEQTSSLKRKSETSQEKGIQPNKEQQIVQERENQSKDLEALSSSVQASQVLREETKNNTEDKGPTRQPEDSSKFVTNVDRSNGSRNDTNPGDVAKKEVERSLDMPDLDFDNSDVMFEKEVLTIPVMEEPDKDASEQSSPRLVTVEISPDSDYVTVIDIINQTKGSVVESVNPEFETREEPRAEEELSTISTLSRASTDNTSEETLKILTPEISDNTSESCNDADTTDYVSDELLISHIADVRSISLEAFERMEERKGNSVSGTEGNVEEEEIKVCLFCSKPSTVACSICLEAKYCSKQCSVLHWEEHYQDCKPVEQSIYVYD